MQLTDRHLGLLQAALGRNDGLLPRPDKLVGAARRRMADRLLGSGVAEIISTREEQPNWFTGAQKGSTGLRITAAGRTLASSDAGQGTRPAVRERVGRNAEAEPKRLAPESGTRRAQAAPHRPGTKGALLLALLRRDGGATVATLADALGWQPHTVRAALTRLRQRDVTINRVPGAGGTVYRALDDVVANERVDAGADA